MPPPSQIIDGQMCYGSRVLTINGLPFIANNIRIARPSTEAQDKTIKGNPGRRRETADIPDFSAELQLATQTTAYPQFGDTFHDTFDSNYGDETFVLRPVPHAEDNGEGNIRVVNITAKKKINAAAIIKVA